MFPNILHDLRLLAIAVMCVLSLTSCGLRERLFESPIVEVGPDVVLIPIARDGKMGYIDKDRRMIIPPRYDSADPFREGFAIVTQGKKYGFIDRRGNNITGFKYDYAEPFSEGLAQVGYDTDTGQKDEHGLDIIDKKRGFIDTTGKEVIPMGKIDSAGEFRYGVAPATVGGKNGYIDRNGETVLPFRVRSYDKVYLTGSGWLSWAGRHSFLNREMKPAFPQQFEWASLFEDGRALIEIDKKYGFIDTSGNTVIPVKYEYAYGFSEGLAPCTRGR
jgi:hypothetical protein